jgi:Zn-dependent peptidase ImmA (M78 family)
MLGHVLAHELGHHVLQHERRLRGERAARTREHEARAEVVATRLRELLD